MSQFVDLHLHSTASDGTLSPESLVREVVRAGLSAMALTDHDTVAGCEAAAAAAAAEGVDFLPGIEISCEFPRPGTLHLLGYGVDPQSPALHRLTRRLIEGRERRNRRLLELLNDAGIDVTHDELLAESGGGTVGRPHLAALLVKKGVVSTVQEAFNRYLGQGGRFYVDKETTSARQAIDLIHEAGGLAVLAHPAQLRRENHAQLMTVIKSLTDMGLDGLEVIHSDHRESLIDHLSDVARRLGLLITGGSDFHGSSKPHIRVGYAGRRRIPRELFDRLLDRLKSSSRCVALGR